MNFFASRDIIFLYGSRAVFSIVSLAFLVLVSILALSMLSKKIASVLFRFLMVVSQPCLNLVLISLTVQSGKLPTC